MAKNSLSGVYSDTKEQGSKLQKSFLIPVSEVECDWDDNIRDLNQEHIDRWISTLEAGDYVPAALVEMRDGVAHIIEGFHRHTAVTQYDPEGLIECKEWKGDADDKLVTMRASTTGLPLTFLEDAEVISEIQGLSDCSSEQLAKRLGISRTAVNNKLLIAESDPKVKAFIVDGAISATRAIEIIIEVGQDKAAKKIQAELDRANRKGTSRVTAGSGPKAFSVAKFRTALELLSTSLDYEDFALNQDEMDGDVDLNITLPKGEMAELVNIIEDYIEHKG